MAETKERVKSHTAWIDVLKGITIILVVIGHNANETVTDFIYCFHMPLFFLLSGFLFSPKPMRKYLTRSFTRLIIPYMMFLLTIAAPQILSAIMHYNIYGYAIGGGKHFIISVLYGGRLLTGAYGVFWFISVLWFATNLFNLILRLNTSPWVLPVMIFVGYLSAMLPIPLPWNIHIVPMALSYIWVGFLIRSSLLPYIQERLKYNMICNIAISVIVLLIIFLLREELTIDMKYGSYGTYVISFISSVFASIAVAIIAISISRYDPLSHALGLVGLASMVVMYLHPPIKYIILSFNLPAADILAILLGISLSLGAYMILDRFKLTQKLYLGKTNIS